MGRELLRLCHCGHPVRVIEPTENSSRIIFCDSCTGVWHLAMAVSKNDLIDAWNIKQEVLKL
jgi:hypothetical protein